MRCHELGSVQSTGRGLSAACERLASTVQSGVSCSRVIHRHGAGFRSFGWSAGELCECVGCVVLGSGCSIEDRTSRSRLTVDRDTLALHTEP